jgi:hypothetical protein
MAPHKPTRAVPTPRRFSTLGLTASWRACIEPVGKPVPSPYFHLTCGLNRITMLATVLNHGQMFQGV